RRDLGAWLHDDLDPPILGTPLERRVVAERAALTETRASNSLLRHALLDERLTHGLGAMARHLALGRLATYRVAVPFDDHRTARLGLERLGHREQLVLAPL